MKYFSFILLVLLIMSCGGGQQSNQDESDAGVADAVESESADSGGSKWASPDNYADPISAFDMRSELSNPIPKKSEVSIAGYPVGELLSWDAGMEVGGKMYAGMKLVSSDPVEKVKEFYDKELSGWSYEFSYEVHSWDKDANAEPMETDRVEVSAYESGENDPYAEYLDNPATLIMVYYQK